MTDLHLANAGLSCSGSDHPSTHRYSTHWTGDNFNTALLGAVSTMIAGGYETFTPYVHPDCGGHHGQARNFRH